MTTPEKINEQVEAYLNKKTTELPDDLDLGSDSYGQFRLHTIKRLRKIYDLYSAGCCSIDDYLIALRDYMLTFQASLSLSGIDIPEHNSYGISRNPQNGRYYASYAFPDYVQSEFAEAAFLRERPEERKKTVSYDLYTDPLIQKITGFTEFKSMAQKLAVYGALNTPDGYTALISMPTGGGKSLVTQTVSYQKDGLTIVIVPTVSLALDQVRVAKQIIKSADVEEEIFSYYSGADQTSIIKAIQQKKAKMLFISPEALINNQGFADVVKKANSSRYLKNIVIDEAHIVVDWGASFRVDYQCLESWRRMLLLENPTIRTVLLSATFEPHCISVLKSFFSESEKWIEIRCDSLRHEPRYMLIQAKSNTDKYKKMLELVCTMPHPMIVYVARPADADEVAAYLSDAGIENVRKFTGLTTSPMRRKLIDQWVDDDFEIMVATSAFGVGVDKSDVRTVLHMYIPQNPNAYYQELGRGGRDRLPCLSIMCIHPEDANVAFQRISKRVMTPEKIIGRWNSMYNNPKSQRSGNYVFIDTTIKPDYSDPDEYDDSPTSEADINWNIYVLLLLRRYEKIRIHDVLPNSGNYIFSVEIRDDMLRSKDLRQQQEIERIRSVEWKYYEGAFQTMRDAVLSRSKNCWSEMFYETYDLVSEYCAGCRAHSEPVEDDFLEFPLKKTVRQPVHKLAADQLALFGGSGNAICVATDRQTSQLMRGLLKQRISLLISFDDEKTGKFLSAAETHQALMTLNQASLRELVKKKSYYYISGIAAVLYSGNSKEVYDQLRYVTNNLGSNPDIKIIHLIERNVYFEWINKVFSDLVDGPVISINSLCSNN